MGVTGAFDALDRTIGALADPRRRRVVELLGERPMAAGELAQARLASAPPLMSRHLRVLRESGLVVAQSHPSFDARVRIYALEARAMTGLKEWVAQTERMWSEQLLAFQAHLEGAVHARGAAESEPR